jgi:hypothetical protein
MKVFTYILSIFIVVLTATPCIDVHYDNELQKTEVSHKVADCQNGAFDHCSPFCTCDCCSTPLFYQTNTIKINSFLFFINNYTVYNSYFVSSLNSSIWQPPKIS